MGASIIDMARSEPLPIRVRDGFDFGVALHALKSGQRVARRGWNGADQWVYYVPGGQYATQTPAARATFGQTASYRPYLAIRTTQGDVATWAPSCSDALADDWFVVGE